MMKKKILLFGLLIIQHYTFGQSPVTYKSAPTNAEINTSLSGPNITITGGQIKNGERTQIATFTKGLNAGLEMPKGVYFSTGIAADDLQRKNTNPAYTNIINTVFSDPDLIKVDPNAKFDVISYEFSITLSASSTGLNIAYQFASEEYPNFVGSIYNDAFGFFVKGPGIIGTENLAKLPNGNITSINTINAGIRGAYGIGYENSLFDESQSANYINNGHTTQITSTNDVQHYLENDNVQPGPFPVYIEHNGVTRLVNYSIRNLMPGGTYNFKIIIADSSDGQMDSGVFVKDISAFMEITAENDFYTVSKGNNVTPTIFLNDTIGSNIPTSNNTVVSSSDLPAGFALNADGTVSVEESVQPGVYTFTYQLCDRTNPVFCASATVEITVLAPPVCYKPATIAGMVLDAQHGITSLGRAGADQDNWPMVRKGAHTVLESKSKGFVINRLTTLQKTRLIPALGMTLFDTDLDCLSIYDGKQWKCYNVQTCPN